MSENNSFFKLSDEVLEIVQFPKNILSIKKIILNFFVYVMALEGKIK